MRGVTIASRIRETLEQRHHRFGLAGESYAATIEQYLVSRPDSVLYVGSGLPDRNRFEHLPAYGTSVILSEDDSAEESKCSSLPDAEFVWANSGRLDKLEGESFGHVLALGLFTSVRFNEVSTMFLKLWRVCRRGGYLTLTNAKTYPKEMYLKAGLRCGFKLVAERDETNPKDDATDGNYLLVFQKPGELGAASAA